MPGGLGGARARKGEERERGREGERTACQIRHWPRRRDHVTVTRSRRKTEREESAGGGGGRGAGEGVERVAPALSQWRRKRRNLKSNEE